MTEEVTTNEPRRPGHRELSDSEQRAADNVGRKLIRASDAIYTLAGRLSVLREIHLEQVGMPGVPTYADLAAEAQRIMLSGSLAAKIDSVIEAAATADEIRLGERYRA